MSVEDVNEPVIEDERFMSETNHSLEEQKPTEPPVLEMMMNAMGADHKALADYSLRVANTACAALAEQNGLKFDPILECNLTNCSSTA